MARKPNYRFERLEREKSKSAKKAARQRAKEEKSDQRKVDRDDEAPQDDGNDPSA